MQFHPRAVQRALHRNRSRGLFRAVGVFMSAARFSRALLRRMRLDSIRGKLRTVVRNLIERIFAQFRRNATGRKLTFEHFQHGGSAQASVYTRFGVFAERFRQPRAYGRRVGKPVLHERKRVCLQAVALRRGNSGRSVQSAAFSRVSTAVPAEPSKPEIHCCCTASEPACTGSCADRLRELLNASSFYPFHISAQFFHAGHVMLSFSFILCKFAGLSYVFLQCRDNRKGRISG